MSLAQYKAKRNLKTTPEPAGGQGSTGQLRFVVQKHAASHLHYDFRLELGGVLLSWAVPKGPSLDPGEKRLAMMVEDHPLDYRNFEGVIPPGNYGAGKVIIWDEGTYTDFPASENAKTVRQNLKAGLAKGDLKFQLHGQKLGGAYVLAKIKTDDKAWLLIKKRDEFATPDEVTEQAQSVRSGRTLPHVAALEAPELDLAAAPEAPQPTTHKPMLATPVAAPFDDPAWLYEIKWDGYRILAHVRGGHVQLKSRNDQDYTQTFAPIAHELAQLGVDCLLDGEVVVLDADGRSDFGALQNYQKTGAGELAYYVFDVPYAAGRDLRRLPLHQRKAAVAAIVAPLERVRFSDHVEGRGTAFFEAATSRNLEGIMAKDASSLYLPGRRSPAWLKIKTHLRQEAVIGGFTEPRGSRGHLGALVLGVFEHAKLRYIGHTGTGMSERTLADLYAQLHRLEQATSPFATPPKTNAPVHWVNPRLLAEIQFTEWTPDGSMRHPTFLGLRDDKSAKTIIRETPMPQKPQTPAKVEITHQGKLFWPDERITKGDLAAYYERIAPVILPYLAGRPESLNRYPGGIAGHSFFHKDLETHPDWVTTVPIFSESIGQDINWLVTNDAPSLQYMINLGCIELNPWLSRVGSLDKPDFCLIDLDAKTSTFEDIIKVAQTTHKLLDELGIAAYPKTSGKTGLHICIPLGSQYTYEQSRQFCQLLMNLVNDRLPDITSVDRNPAKRVGKIYLDFLQNRQGQTMAAPYCVRPVPGAPVSTPLKWSEVRRGLDPQKFTIATIHRRLDKVGDLWTPILTGSIDMAAVLEKLS